jgi:hypothetical protein
MRLPINISTLTKNISSNKMCFKISKIDIKSLDLPNPNSSNSSSFQHFNIIIALIACLLKLSYLIIIYAVKFSCILISQ